MMTYKAGPDHVGRFVEHETSPDRRFQLEYQVEGGMTVAFSDVTHLRDALAPFENYNDRNTIKDAVEGFHVNRKPLASTINILANALYNVFAMKSIFFSVEKEGEVGLSMRHACLSYFRLGGSAVSGPISLLSGYCDSY